MSLEHWYRSASVGLWFDPSSLTGRRRFSHPVIDPRIPRQF